MLCSIIHSHHNAAHKENKMTISEKIKAARKTVNALEFGTDAWESAMQAVRAMVSEQAATSPAFEYTSIDGNVFLKQAADGRWS